MQVHKNEDLVENEMRKPRKERKSILDDLKTKGIEKYNLLRLDEVNSKLICERSNKVERGDSRRTATVNPDQFVKCSRCTGFFCHKYLSQNQKHCGESDVPMAMKLAKIK